MNEPNVIPSQPRPLELSRRMWVAIGMVGLIGLQEHFGGESSSSSLRYLAPESSVLARSNESDHYFNQLGIRVQVTEGWTYLATTDDRVALSPTFSNANAQVILRVQAFNLDEWPPENAILKPIKEVEDLELEFYTVGRLLLGKLVIEEVELAIVVMEHGQGEQVMQEILGFCRRIQVASTGLT